MVQKVGLNDHAALLKVAANLLLITSRASFEMVRMKISSENGRSDGVDIKLLA